ncbi:MAG: DUF2065 domain-containing protein [Candidatus Electrothrix sp. AUS1_2]|nr:DUF2065 domain-containing protein [Candidatus Electrothrix sp. AUS1_2]
MKTLISLIGLVLIFEGLPYVASPEGMQRKLKQLIEMHPGSLRVMGLMAMAIGFLFCYIGQRTGLLG